MAGLKYTITMKASAIMKVKVILAPLTKPKYPQIKDSLLQLDLKEQSSSGICPPKYTMTKYNPNSQP